ncbi:MAG: UDP-N-acetylglucosamine 2-epimerase [Bacteroidales bacterium]
MGRFILCTIHRELNTDNPERLDSIIRSVIEIAETSDQRIVIPFHPRTIIALERDKSHLLKALKKHDLIEILPLSLTLK